MFNTVKVKDYKKVFKFSDHWTPGKKIKIPGKDGRPLELTATKDLFLWENKRRSVIAAFVPSEEKEGIILNTAEEGIAAVYALMYVILKKGERSKDEIALMGLQAVLAMKEMMNRFVKQCRSKKAGAELESKTFDWALRIAIETKQLNTDFFNAAGGPGAGETLH